MKYSIIEISGGIGKNIMATAVVENIKKTFPEREVLVITAYPEVFIANPYVHKVFKFGGTPYFHETYVHDHDVKFFCQEPYRSPGYLSQSEHLIESWSKDIGVEISTQKTSLYLTINEMETAAGKIFAQKPILVFQPFGGGTKDRFEYCWNRDLPPNQAQKLANILSEKYHVVQLFSGSQPKLEGCESVNLPLRDVFALIRLSEHFLLIDSFAQHACNALNKKATVCWITNKPLVFGYGEHRNVLPSEENTGKLNQLIDGYFHEYDFSGARHHDYPFKTSDVFNITEIAEPFMRG